jgi:hypothetical protein
MACFHSDVLPCSSACCHASVLPRLHDAMLVTCHVTGYMLLLVLVNLVNAVRPVILICEPFCCVNMPAHPCIEQKQLVVYPYRPLFSNFLKLVNGPLFAMYS